jgi:hypothetical protein
MHIWVYRKPSARLPMSPHRAPNLGVSGATRAPRGMVPLLTYPPYQRQTPEALLRTHRGGCGGVIRHAHG